MRIGSIDKSKCSENRAIFPKDDMSAGRSTALQCIVHARQVIEQKRGSMKVFERNSKVLSITALHPIGGSHLEDQSGPDQTPWVGKYMPKRIFKVGIKRTWQRQSRAKGFFKWLCSQRINQFRCGHSAPRLSQTLLCLFRSRHKLPALFHFDSRFQLVGKDEGQPNWRAEFYLCCDDNSVIFSAL